MNKDKNCHVGPVLTLLALDKNCCHRLSWSAHFWGDPLKLFSKFWWNIFLTDIYDKSNTFQPLLITRWRVSCDLPSCGSPPPPREWNSARPQSTSASGCFILFLYGCTDPAEIIMYNVCLFVCIVTSIWSLFGQKGPFSLVHLLWEKIPTRMSPSWPVRTILTGSVLFSMKLPFTYSCGLFHST